MPYIYDPRSNSSVWYPEGSTPPTLTPTGEEQIPGWGDFYTQNFPNQPYSQQNPSTAAPTGATGADALDPTKRDAYAFLLKLFQAYGLDSLAPKILEYVQQGYGPDTITLMLQDTAEYKERFKANDIRKKNGLSILSPAEYLSVERTYRQILESAGMPKGFYDSQDDFAKWIGDDVSPTEMNARVGEAAKAMNNTDDNYLKSLREYGLGDGDLVAAMLDRSRALPILQKVIREAEIGAEARRQGLQLTKQRASYFESMGVSGGDAQSAYETIGEVLPSLEQLGRIYGRAYGQADIENELLGHEGLASAKRKGLQSREVGSFAGTSSINERSLAGKSRGEF